MHRQDVPALRELPGAAQRRLAGRGRFVAQRALMGELAAGGNGEFVRVVGLRGIEACEVIDDELRQQQPLIADRLHDALRELVAAEIVVMGVVDLAAGIGKCARAALDTERSVERFAQGVEIDESDTGNYSLAPRTP